MYRCLWDYVHLLLRFFINVFIGFYLNTNLGKMLMTLDGQWHFSLVFHSSWRATQTNCQNTANNQAPTVQTFLCIYLFSTSFYKTVKPWAKKKCTNMFWNKLISNIRKFKIKKLQNHICMYVFQQKEMNTYIYSIIKFVNYIHMATTQHH